MRELDRNVTLSGGQVILIVDINTGTNLMSALKGYPFDDFTHFPVAKQNYFHTGIIGGKIAFFTRE
jgi:hypothetical protein